MSSPLNFGKTMLASALGMVIAIVAINILSFILLMAFIVSLSSITTPAPVNKDDIVLTIDLGKPLQERTPSEAQALFGNTAPLGLDQLLLAIDRAADDDEVKAIFLRFSATSSLGWAQAQELREALLDFQSRSSKPVLSYGEAYSQASYYLASATSLVALHPAGELDFRGIGGEVMFYKGLLDKLGVHMELIRPSSNAYKSAGETYTRTDMSSANREQVHAYINDTWQYVLEGISASRNIPVSDLNAIADHLSGFLAHDALNQHMIDTLCFEQDIRDQIKSRYHGRHFVTASRYAKGLQSISHKDRIAVIYAEGDVVSGKSDGLRTGVYSDDIVKAFSDAAKDKRVKAIVLRVNSPGGAVTASESMTHAIRLAREQKPVIVSMSGVAASAGYEISCFANKIVAQPTTITGSIGVFATLPEIGTLLRQKLGITTDTVQTNANAMGLSLMRPLSPAARATMQRSVEDFYRTFCSRVAEGRELTPSYVDSIGRGRVWTGRQAQLIGLVDTLGGMPLALRIAAQEAGIERYSIVSYPKQQDLIDVLTNWGQEREEAAVRARLNVLIPFYSELERWANMEPLQARLPFALEIR